MLSSLGNLKNVLSVENLGMVIELYKTTSARKVWRHSHKQRSSNPERRKDDSSNPTSVQEQEEARTPAEIMNVSTGKKVDEGVMADGDPTAEVDNSQSKERSISPIFSEDVIVKGVLKITSVTEKGKGKVKVFSLVKRLSQERIYKVKENPIVFLFLSDGSGIANEKGKFTSKEG